MQFGDSKVMFGDHMEGVPGWGPNHMRLMHRAGRVRDPFGNEWFLATHIEDVTPKEMDRRMHEMMAGGGGSDSSEEE
jgi:hypothetical protein